MSRRLDELPLPRHALLLHVREGALELRRRRHPRGRARDLLPRRRMRCSPDRGVPRTTASCSASSAPSCSSIWSASTTWRRRQALDQFAKGLVKFVIHFAFLAVARRLALAARGALLLARARLVLRRGGGQRGVRHPPAARRARRRQPRLALLSPITGGASQINVYGAVEGGKVYRPNALTGDPNHLGIMLIVPAARPDAALPPARARTPAQAPARAADRVSLRGRDRDAFAQRPARARRRRARARASRTAATWARARSSARSSGRSGCSASSS